MNIVTNEVALWAASYSACVVYTKTIIHLSVGESGGYLPCRFATWYISTTIHLHFSEELLNIAKSLFIKENHLVTSFTSCDLNHVTCNMYYQCKIYLTSFAPS